MRIVDKIKSILRINYNVIKAEADEVKSLQITEDDERQGRELAVLVAAGLAACGIPCGVGTTEIIAKVLSYALRDLKDGVAVHDKLIVSRVKKEIEIERLSKAEKAKENLYKSLNKD